MRDQFSMEFDEAVNGLKRVLQYRAGASFLEPIDKVNLALIKLFNPEFDTHGVPAFKSLRAAYIELTGDTNLTGTFHPENIMDGLKASTSFNSTSFQFALQNALNSHVSKEYKRFPYREEIFISDKKSAKDFRTIDSIQFDYYGDLPEIDPESADYSMMPKLDDSTKASYGVEQKGSILWVSRKAIINDAVDIVKTHVSRMTRSARMTHAKKVWSFYLNNSNAPDGISWFHADHGNLTAGALTVPNLTAAITALATMIEPGASGQILGIDFATFDWHLVIPVTLWGTAVAVNQNRFYLVANDLIPNPCYRLFGDKNERIIVCPFSVDANDWGVLRGNEDVPMVEMSYLNAQQEPELFIHQGATDERVFARDEIGYKIRHEYGGALVEYRGGYKAINP